MTPANEIARPFDAQCETAKEQFERVIFLDGQERRTKAVEARLRVSGKVGGSQSGTCFFKTMWK